MSTPFGPDSTVTTTELLERHAQREPNRTFLKYRGGEWSYGETLNRARAVGAGLRRLGVVPGEYVASMLPTSSEAIVALLGVNAAGGVQVPLNVSYRGSILQHTLTVSTARHLIVHRDLVAGIARVQVPALETLIVVGGEPDTVPSGLKIVQWEELEDCSPEVTPPDHRRAPWDDMVVIFTSGTTGPSKGVRCSYLHHAHYSRQWRVRTLGADDRVLLILPMFHVGGTSMMYAELLWGGSAALVERFSTTRFWEDVRELRPTWGLLVDSMASFLLKSPPAADDHDHPLRILTVTSPHFAPVMRERFGIEVMTGFGMSELPGGIRTPLPLENTRSIGSPHSPDWHVKIVDDHDFELPRGTVGECVIRCDSPWAMMSGYLGMPEATAHAWRNGWFHTGDLMYQDEAGDFYFVDRKKDAVRRRGENISSFEVEAEILSHPDVLEVAVVAVPSAEGEDEVLAVVVRRPEVSLTEPDLLNYLVPRMAHFMVPRYIRFVDVLPKTPTSKVRKIELREQGLAPGTWDREAVGQSIKAPRIGGRQ